MLGEEGLKLVQTLCDQRQWQPYSNARQPLPYANNNDGRVPVLLEHQRASHTAGEFHEPADTVIDDSVWKDLPTKGAFYMVIESGELQSIRATMRSLEDRFNHRHHYPWVLLSNQYLTADFRKYITKLTNAPIFFGKIDPELWDYPSWVSAVQVEGNMDLYASSGVSHATSLLFRQRSRYHAGFFFHHPLLQNVDYAWRVQPGSDYSCDLDTDPFLEMEEKNKTLGFIFTGRETPLAVRSIHPLTMEFMRENRQLLKLKSSSIFPWLIDFDNPLHDKAEAFNYCQIQSNFAITKLSYLRSDLYQAYFSFLDGTGGFYYERWTDGAVQTLAAAMFLQKEQLHHFNQIGYSYGSATHCPWNNKDLESCSCDITSATDFSPDSCTLDLVRLIDKDILRQVATFAGRHQDSLEVNELIGVLFGNIKKATI